MTAENHTTKASTLTKTAAVAFTLYGLVAAYPAIKGFVTGDHPAAAQRADVTFLQEAMDARMMSMPIVAPGVMKVLGVEAIMFADDHVTIDVPLGFDHRMTRLHEIADGLVDYAGVIGFDPALFDTLIAQGEVEAKMGLWTVDQLADAAEVLADMNATLENRTRFSVSYMNGNDFTEQEAIDFASLTMKTLMPTEMAEGDPTLFDSIFNTDASQMHVEVGEIWGGLDGRFEYLTAILADKDLTAAEAVIDLESGPTF